MPQCWSISQPASSNVYLYACQLAETRANEREHPEVDPDKYEYIIAYFVDVRLR